MRERVFRFKQFSVRHEKCAMKVGTDGVLLGAWCDVENAKSTLDIGTGSGLIALMVAQRNPQTSVLAIDIEPLAIEEANINFANSPWADRLRAIEADFVSFSELTEMRFDLIVSNPPFFVDSLTCPDTNRSTARHTTQLPFDKLISGAANLLTPEGKLCLITPTDCENLISNLLLTNNLHITGKTFVHPTPNALPKRILWKISNHMTAIEEHHLTIEIERHQYTKSYIALTQQFYLKM
ncbi:MAG: tRNA1(Val) (adenine(37)-N6)-methyltransferase [Muribaculaceae bacterium]